MCAKQTNSCRPHLPKSKSESQIDDPLSDEETSGLTSPTRQSFRTPAFSSKYYPLYCALVFRDPRHTTDDTSCSIGCMNGAGYSSPGGDLSDEEFDDNGAHGFEPFCVANNYVEFPEDECIAFQRNRSGSWASRR